MEYAFITTVLLVFTAELGDKTMISTITLALASKKIIGILFSSTLGFLLASLIVAYGGSLLSALIDPSMLQIAASLMFIIVGLWMYLAREEDSKRYTSTGLLASLLIVFVSEMGDKTQLVVFTSSMLWSSPILVVVAGTLGYFLANLLGLLIARSISTRFPWSRVKRALSILMIATGVIVALNSLLA